MTVLASNKKENSPVSKQFFSACLLVLLGVVALWVAVELLARFWGWLVLIIVVVAAVWGVVVMLRARADRW